MILYHFCADHLLPAILREGLTLGRIAWTEKGQIRMRYGFQWLTEDPDREKQEWCNPEYSTLPYDRAANRLTVVIPKEAEVNLSRWVETGPLIMPAEQFRILNIFGEPEKHWLYRGNVRPAWIVAVNRLGARWRKPFVSTVAGSPAL